MVLAVPSLYDFVECGFACIAICARTRSDLDEVEKAIHKANERANVHTFTSDIADEKQVLTIAEIVKKEEGKLNVPVNNAEASDQWTSIADSIVDDY